MKEYTVVTTIQFTEIIRADDFNETEYRAELTEALIEEGELDDVENTFRAGVEQAIEKAEAAAEAEVKAE